MVFCGVRGEWGRIPEVLAETVGGRELAHFVPVFLEAVGVAFVFVRLQWVMGRTWALLVPCLLFALAHVPGQLDDGRSAFHIAAFFALDTLLPLVIFAVVVRSRDVIWIGFAHYIMDVAIDSFG